VPYDEGSAKEQGRCFLRMTRGPGVGYPKGGCLGLTNAQLRGLKRCGVDVRLRHRVDHIECEDGRVRAVWSRGERFAADAVFSNAGVRRTAELAGADAVGEGYLRQARALTDSLAGIMIRYTLEEPVIPDRVLWSMPDLPADETCDRIRRGDLDLPIAGSGPRTPMLFMATPTEYDGAVGYAGRGSSYMKLTRFAPDGGVEAVSIKPWGNSDDPGSPHHADLTELYAAQQYKPLWFEREEVEADLASTTTLTYQP